MTIAEKLRFLADRAEDGKEFYISTFTNPYFFDTEELIRTKDHQTAFRVSAILEYSVSLKKPIVFTEDEKAILRNLPTHLNWLTRNIGDVIYVSNQKPSKSEYEWLIKPIGLVDIEYLSMYGHLFQCIRWSDNEPCEFRKYL